MSCRATNAKGGACDAPDHMVDETGYCPAHREGGAEHMRGVSSEGGKASARARSGGGFTAVELLPIVTLEDAKLALVQIRDAVLTRRITHSEGATGAKSVSEWVKTESAAATARLVGELTKELADKTKEIDALRQQLAQPQRMRVG